MNKPFDISRIIFLLLIGLISIPALSFGQTLSFEHYPEKIQPIVDLTQTPQPLQELSQESIVDFYSNLENVDPTPLVGVLLQYKADYHLNDWMYYQLIRKTADRLCPKTVNYNTYTLYKWYLLSKSGYEATLSVAKDRLLFYVRSSENIYGIPFFSRDGKQFICLNYHDFGCIDFDQEKLFETPIRIPEGVHGFSYKVTELPEFVPEQYVEKKLEFSYNDQVYHFKVKLNPEIQKAFKNYPVVDFETYFNVPLSRATYYSLIPDLKKNMEGLTQKEGVDYLMHFTRSSLAYETDQQNFGKERRLTPEQTLLYDYSDCDDRAALFFYLVKEVYNLPMIVMLYPTHVTIAVRFDHPSGPSVVYKGQKYSVCDPTPQQEDLAIGEISRKLKRSSYEVVYEYQPRR
ncbi:MAG: hypothetical protein JNJ58_08015 [Chitinophagaceae bacterium]|nr:hypothetical protein [Chitinophagaceae bacterium]